MINILRHIPFRDRGEEDLKDSLVRAYRKDAPEVNFLRFTLCYDVSVQQHEFCVLVRHIAPTAIRRPQFRGSPKYCRPAPCRIHRHDRNSEAPAADAQDQSDRTLRLSRVKFPGPPRISLHPRRPTRGLLAYRAMLQKMGDLAWPTFRGKRRVALSQLIGQGIRTRADPRHGQTMQISPESRVIPDHWRRPCGRSPLRIRRRPGCAVAQSSTPGAGARSSLCVARSRLGVGTAPPGTRQPQEAAEVPWYAVTFRRGLPEECTAEVGKRACFDDGGLFAPDDALF